ncbi:MAG: hypothetical protein AABY68_06160 [Pseudomonadota bacterium]
MFRIDNSGAVASLPNPQAAGAPGYFGRGDSSTGLKATPLSADWANAVQEELVSMVLAAGLTLSKTTRTQVRDAIAALYLSKAGGVLTGAVGIVPGTAAAPGLYFSGDTNTGMFSPGADQIGFATGGVERRRVGTDGSMSSVIPGGSVLYPEFGCRAWVSFNGTGTVAIRGSGNVTSITDNGVGDYAANYTTAMPDPNYAFTFGGYRSAANDNLALFATTSAPTISSLRIKAEDLGGVAVDPEIFNISIFR